MAQKVTVEMTDDLDGSEADATVRFAVDGTAYEIDLSKKNASKMRRDFGRYIEHARKARARAPAATSLGLPRRFANGRARGIRLRRAHLCRRRRAV
jgi:hypothetical protein